MFRRAFGARGEHTRAAVVFFRRRTGAFSGAVAGVLVREGPPGHAVMHVPRARRAAAFPGGVCGLRPPRHRALTHTVLPDAAVADDALGERGAEVDVVGHRQRGGGGEDLLAHRLMVHDVLHGARRGTTVSPLPP